MKIVAAAVAVDIQDFAAGVEAGHQAGSHGAAVKVSGRDAAGSDLSLAKTVSIIDVDAPVFEQGGIAGQFFAGQAVCCAGQGRDAAGFERDLA